MKILAYITSLCIAGVLLFNACSQKEINSYQEDARVFLRIPGEFDNTTSQDSLIYSFPYKPALNKDTIWFEANIMGNTANVDREFTVSIDAGTTAVPGTDFDPIISGIIPAGAFKANIPIVIYKTEAIRINPVRLKLSVIENSNFKVGFTNNTSVILVWADKFLQPSIWTETSNYFQAFSSFSQAKTQFILGACHLDKLPDPNNRALLTLYNKMVRDSITNYYRRYYKNPKDDSGYDLYIPIFGTPGVG